GAEPARRGRRGPARCIKAKCLPPVNHSHGLIRFPGRLAQDRLMNKVTINGNDGLWARIRAALNRGADSPEPAYGQAAIARNAGKKSPPAQLIDDAFRHGWADAAGRLVSLCVLALEMDGHADYFAAYGREVVEHSIEALEQAIGRQLPRPTDRCLRHGRAGFVLVLPDMPVLMARELASRIAAAIRQAGLPNRESHA